MEVHISRRMAAGWVYMCGGMWVLGERKGGAAESGDGVERGSRSEVIAFWPPLRLGVGEWDVVLATS